MKICLIGSTKFRKLYEEVNIKLTLAGHIVYSVAGFGHSGDTFTEEEKIVLDLVHLRKIIESDAVYIVTDESGYYGFSTNREITWAKINDILIYDQRNLSALTYPLKHQPPVQKIIDFKGTS